MNSKTKLISRKLLFFLAPTFWFLVGFVIASLTLISIILIYFQVSYQDKAIPGVYIGSLYVGEKTQEEIKQIFDEKNKKIDQNTLIFTYYDYEATVSAEQLGIGYDSSLISTQALDLGKSGNIISDFYFVIDSYLNGTSLPVSYTFDKETLTELLDPIQQNIYIEPIDALFTVENNRVTTFQPSSNGRTIDFEKALNSVQNQFPRLIASKEPITIRLPIPVSVLEPKLTTEKANNLGIVEVIGEGHSTYKGSIANRAFNVSHAASKVNGALVAPGEEFSFNKTIGDISKLTGYKEAYVIQSGRTVLGDGGGVCQVSTTLFRAILNAGLPITERYGHAYRVGYYEQESPPGLDATIYVPSVDFKFKNDTEKHILIQSYVDSVNMGLTFVLYGTRDGREVTVSTPVITRQIPPPEPHYQDDPELPKGQEKQVEHSAYGARVVFNRTVKKDGAVLHDDTFTTNYQPWRAVFLRGTKE